MHTNDLMLQEILKALGAKQAPIPSYNDVIDAEYIVVSEETVELLEREAHGE